jgi:UDP-glucuronate decarboxylase
MLELAAKVLELVGGGSPIEHLPLPADDPVRRRPNIDRAIDLLQWSPSVPLDDGLGRTVEYFKGIVR